MDKKIKLYIVALGIVYILILVSDILGGAGIYPNRPHELGMSEDYIAIKDKYPDRGFTFSEGQSLKVRTLYPNTPKIQDLGNGVIQYSEVESFNIKVEKPFREESLMGKIEIIALAVFCLLVVGICLLYLPFLFISIVRMVMIKKVVNDQLVKRIMRIGWILVGLFILGVLGGTLNFFKFTSEIQLEGYEILMPNLHYGLLLQGILTLFIGEMLRTAIKMKEEQDLTV